MPIKKDKNTELLITQYDGSMVEDAGLLKMDLLGLKTLSIIRDACHLIKKVHSKKIDIANIPLTDEKTFELYQQGSTKGIFQFESEGMMGSLKELRPTQLEHLIAMNALYRPGPMKNIPSYIARMHGKEEVDTMHPALQEVLSPTYGIPVYQEQIMQMAQIMAGYTLGQADLLRRAMGKKKKEEMQKQEKIFIQGAKKHHDLGEKESKAIFDTMSHFAEYGFNRSHSAAYTLLSYQTAYLKAHYPAAYMASVLIHNQGNMDKITFFIEECKALGVEVKGPDINKSHIQFYNDAEQNIRFGLAAIKGIGVAAVESLIAEREAHGPFIDLHDLVKRMIQKSGGKVPSKKVLETLAISGAFESLGNYHRKQYVHADEGTPNFIEQVLLYEKKQYKQKNSSQQLLFSLASAQVNRKPSPSACNPYTDQEKLKMEKELVGFYLSGHPLDAFTFELKSLCNADSTSFTRQKNAKEVRLAGVVAAVSHRQNSKGSHFGILTLEDYKGTLDIMLFGQLYNKHRYLLLQDQFVFLKGKVKARYGREDQLDFRPEIIEPLDIALEKYTRALQLTIPLALITSTFIQKIEKLMKRYQGPCEVHIYLPHEKTKSLIRTLVKKYRITPSKQFFQELDHLGVRYTTTV